MAYGTYEIVQFGKGKANRSIWGFALTLVETSMERERESKNVFIRDNDV